ncbi:MAG: hypothetical protein J6M44_09530 [Butyrivibrio sp.]|nr:hypothetical protein [Butyrivibrio sp.]
MRIDKDITFYEASTFISFVRKNLGHIRSNKILNVYYTSLSGEMGYGQHETYMTDTPLIIEFEGFAVQIEYYFHSNMRLRIVDTEKFYNGEMTRYIIDYESMKKNPMPFDKASISEFVENCTIKDIEIGRFSDEFITEPSSDSVRLEGGDYFFEISIVLENDTKIFINAQDAESDGYMEYSIKDVHYRPEGPFGLKKYSYEVIE